MKKIIITMGSVTIALKSKKLLGNAGIRSRLIKIDSSITDTGCTHGLEIDYNMYYDSVAILRSHSIEIKVYSGKGD